MKRTELFFAFLLVPLDIVMILLAFVAAYYWRSSLEGYSFTNIGLFEYLRYAFYLLPIWIALFSLNGLYKIRNTTGVFYHFYPLVVSVSTAILILVVMIFLTKSLFFSRLILIATWFFAIAFIYLGRMLLQAVQHYLLKFGIGIRNIAIVGYNSATLDIAKFASNKYSGYRVAGFFADDAPRTAVDLKYLGVFDNIPARLKKHQIDEIIVTDSGLGKTQMMEVTELCSILKISFKFIPDLLALMSHSFQVNLFGSYPVMELRPIPLDGWGRIIKRIFDFLFAAFLLILLSPLLLVIAIGIKLTSKGPVFYKHARIGRDEQPFSFYKFRSMYIDKCDFRGGIYWTTKNDEKTRITPFGRILRKTNVDELPQLWNILIGDMSFVGPRPELPKLVEKFEKEIPDYFRRHHVKTGLTGWAQVNGLKGDTSIEERVKYDIYYIENWSIWLDLKIIIKTVFLVVYETFFGKVEYSSRP